MKRSGIVTGQRSLAAARLNLCVYTVEAHLSRAHAKPGIGSRAQLVRVLAACGSRAPPGRWSKLPGFP